MMTTTPPTINVKKSAGTHGDDDFGFGLGGGWRRTRLPRLFGMMFRIVATPPDNHFPCDS